MKIKYQSHYGNQLFDTPDAAYDHDKGLLTCIAEWEKALARVTRRGTFGGKPVTATTLDEIQANIDTFKATWAEAERSHTAYYSENNS